MRSGTRRRSRRSPSAATCRRGKRIRRDGPFVGQHPLTDAEIALIRAWVDEGAVEGDPRAVSAARRNWTEGWQLGKPDLVVTLPPPYTLPPEGTDAFRIFVLPIPVDGVRFVRGIEFRPGNPQVVHHANIRIDTTPTSRAARRGGSGARLRRPDCAFGAVS